MDPTVPWRKKEVRSHLDDQIVAADKSIRRAKTDKSKARAQGRKQALVGLRRDLFGEDTE